MKITQVQNPEYLESLESQKAIEQAKENGWMVVVPEPDELLIDIDNPSQYTEYCNRMTDFQRFFEVKNIEIKPSKSGLPGKLHITVKLDKPVVPLERIALQAILGSDSKREFLSYVRLQNGDSVPTLFLEKK